MIGGSRAVSHAVSKRAGILKERYIVLDLEARQKGYEDVTRLPKDHAIILRVDGKAFHTWTKHADKPFDVRVSNAMLFATKQCALKMQGVKLAYTQSDETTFLLTTTGESDAWFDFRVQKIASVTASMFTAYFNGYYGNGNPAIFDCRAFSCPLEDAANNLYWRHLDATRNSVQSMAHKYLTRSMIMNNNVGKLRELLKKRGHSWEEMPGKFKYGTFLYRFPNLLAYSNEVDYYKINEMAGINASITD